MKRFCILGLMALALSCFNALPALAATPIGKLYTMGNASAGNAVLVYTRYSDGSLTGPSTIPTNGNGTGGGLGNQGGLAISDNGYFLFAVNAGSHSLSMFRITATGLKLVGTVPSGGNTPVSVTEDRGRVFVLNAGNAATPGNIVGFRVDSHHGLSLMPFATRHLSSTTAGTGGAQIQFSDDGRQLVVTEKATNLILVYNLSLSNVPSKPIINPSSGDTPFGFAVGKRDTLFVSNAEGGAANISTLSSYRILPDGNLKTRSAEVQTGESAACWVALTPDGRFAFTTNTASGTVSSFKLNMSGKADLVESVAGNTGTGSGPIDMAMGKEGRFLYALNGGNQSISSFAVGIDGKLTLLTTKGGVPVGANGLIAD